MGIPLQNALSPHGRSCLMDGRNCTGVRCPIFQLVFTRVRLLVPNLLAQNQKEKRFRLVIVRIFTRRYKINRHLTLDREHNQLSKDRSANEESNDSIVVFRPEHRGPWARLCGSDSSTELLL